MSIVNNKSIRLQEIDIIRSLVIVILVAFHSFAPFTGGWGSPENVSSDNTAYFWIGKLLYSGMLETFVFISGYVFALGDSKHNYSISSLILSKLQRLYLPCLFFGILIILLNSTRLSFSLQTALNLISGVGHLWFLPMLFWCFIIEKIYIRYIGLNSLWILLIIAILPYPTLPLRLNSSFYYLFFFHLGYLIFNKRDIVKTMIMNLSSIRTLVIFIIYVLVFFCSTLVQKDFALYDNMPLYDKAFNSFVITMSRLVCSVLAVLIYYKIGFTISTNVSSNQMSIYRNIAMLSFGIYIFQEIILRVIYYKTSFCSVVTGLFYPWVGFIIAFIISYIMSWLCSKTPVLKKII